MVGPSLNADVVQPRPNLLSGITAGLVTSFVDITAGISFATLIFTGPLEPYLARGIALVFVSAIIHAVFSARFTARRGLVSVIQDNPVVLLAVIAASVAAAMGPGPELFGTVLALIMVTTHLTALVLLLLGMLRLGRLVRYIPYPVIGGFLCGTGWLLVTGAISSMTGYTLAAGSLSALLNPEVLVLWVPGVLLGLGLSLANRRFDHFLVTPAILTAGLVFFYGALLLSGTSIQSAGEQGLILGTQASHVVWQPPVEIASANWGVILGQIGSIGAIVLIAVVDLLLGISGLEAELHKDLNLNKELRLNGTANFLSGVFGGMIGYPSLGVFAPGFRKGTQAQAISIVLASSYVVLLVLGTSIFAYLPKALIGGVLFSLGLEFLSTWLVGGRKSMNRTDFSVVVLIFITIVLFGFLVGVTIGLLLMIGLFVVNYSRLNIFHSAASGAEISSHVQRSANYQRALADLGRQVYILELDGFLFFGTANLILERVRQRVEARDEPQVEFLVLDFRRVTSLDSSAAFSLSRVADLALRNRFSFALSSVNDAMKLQLKRIGLKLGTDIRVYPDLDHALEACENTLLLKAQVTRFHYALDIESQLADNGFLKRDAERLKVYLERMTFQPGQIVINQGEVNSLYFIVEGQVSLYLEAASHRVRVQTLGPGTIVGEDGLYLDSPRPASVIADEPTIAYRLERAALEHMKVKDSDLAFQVSEMIIRIIAERLLAADREILALNRE